MTVRVEKTSSEASGPEEISAMFEEEGLSPHVWGNGPNYEYGWHSHGYHKVLYCVSGGIVSTPRKEISRSRPEAGLTWSRA